jgi:hypothetical protein
MTASYEAPHYTVFLHLPITSFLFDPTIPLISLFSNTLLYAFPLMSETMHHANTKLK